MLPDKGIPYVELVGIAGSAGGAEEARAYVAKHRRQLACVVVDGQTGSADFAQGLREDGMRGRGLVVEAGTGDYIAACAMTMQAVRKRELAHMAQGPLDDSARMSRQRKVGRSGIGADNGADMPCAPIESAALALWGARTTKRDPRRRAVVR